MTERRARPSRWSPGREGSWHQLPSLLVVLLLVLFSVACGRPDMARRQSKTVASASPMEPVQANAEVAALRDSVHAELDCSDCHARPPKPGDQKVGEQTRCVPCHADAAKAYEKSVHGQALAHGNRGAARCRHCHGAHDIRKVDDPRSLVFKRTLPLTCATCHRNPEVAERLGIHNKYAASSYFESIHGRALLVEGLTVAPSCVDCHGASHTIERASNPKSTINRQNVHTTCGKCHAGVDEEYKQSIHGQKLAAGDDKAPVCTDCHQAHAIESPGKGFWLASDRMCGRCHADRLDQYLETYHGRAHDLGDEETASCFDCHTAHSILPTSDPKSSLSPQNRANTCRKCHEGTSDKFASFYAHGDHSDRENYPALFWVYAGMTTLLIGTFGFFWLHTLLWFVRALIDYRRHPEMFRELKRHAREGTGLKYYSRFRPVDRFCHFLLILSFLLLVATGMPLKFHQAPWARVAFDWLGGAQVAAGLHRIGAVLTLIYMLIHLTSMSRILLNSDKVRDDNGKLRVRRVLAMMFGPDSPLPNPQDARDAWAQLKWFFGRGARPHFDRWTYWEKFDYMAVFWGVTVIGLSGLVMWFPEAVTRLLPGWTVNVAHVIHSDEALLAAGFIFTVHFFNSHFRPEKFPMDPVMFAGSISEEELKHERPRQYARLVQSGELDKLEVKGDWPSWRPIFAPIGAIAVFTGLLLAVAIFWAMGRLILGL